MQGQEYYKDSAARVLELMKATFGSYFTYFDGEPENLNESQLPCLMITTPSIAIESGATATDDIAEELTIIIALNKKDDIGADSNDDLTMYRLRKLIMGQDPSDQNTSIASYVENSVMYAIRKHITFNGGSTNNTVLIDFDVNIRGENVVTQEAYITIRVDRQALILVRD